MPISHKRDELGLVARRCNDLLQAIADHIHVKAQTDEELRQKDLYVRQILNDSPIGITVVNQQRKRVFVNRRFVEMLGAESEQQLLDNDVADSFVFPDDADRILELEDPQKSAVEGIQIERKRIDGSSWWCLMDIRRMVFDGEDVAVNYHYDITERVLAEEENKRLEHRLEQSKRLEMVGTLAGGIAHDFNNILTPILGYAQMALVDLPADSPLHDDLREIEKAAKRAKKLIQQVLNFSRKQPGTRSQVLLEELVVDGISLIKASIPMNMELEFQLVSPGLRVWGDPSQLDQVLMNLLTNAIDAIGEQPGHILVTLDDFRVDRDFAANYPQLKPGDYLRLSVADDGCGIDAMTQERIFDPFFTTKEPGKGSGVGLATSHRITIDHGGLLQVESTEGQGATFILLLPLLNAVQVSPTASTQVPPGETKESTGARWRIVYVDDDEKNARFAERLLFRLGYDVAVFTSPLEAIAEIASHPQQLDLLITDRSMPELSGYDLIARVHELRPELPVVLVSGFAPDEDQKQRQLNISGFLNKPFEKDELAELLERLLNATGTTN